MTDAMVQARFWSKVQVGRFYECWEWTAHRHRQGYGQFYVAATRRLARAHRVAWELTNGSIPDGLWVLHSCDNPPCVNPSHLFLGDRAANMRDAAAKGRLYVQQHPGVMRKAGLAFHARVDQRGERNPIARLTEDDVRMIRSRPLSGRELARQLSVNTSTVGQVRRGETWRHVA